MKPDEHESTKSEREAIEWRDFLQSMYPRAFHLAYRWSRGDRELAREAVHNAFARLLRNAPEFRSLKSPSAYVYIVIRSSLADEYRHRKQWAADEGNVENWPAPADDPVSLRLDIDRLISGLALEQRRILELRIQGMTTREIAQRLGMSYSAVAMRMTRLRKTLKTQIK